jgi:hypothetical protein
VKERQSDRLEDDDVSELHDFNGRQVFRSLGLWTRFVACNQQECGVHDSGAVKHRGHENVVPRTIDKGDMPLGTMRHQAWGKTKKTLKD